MKNSGAIFQPSHFADEETDGHRVEVTCPQCLTTGLDLEQFQFVFFSDPHSDHDPTNFY